MREFSAPARMLLALIAVQGFLHGATPGHWVKAAHYLVPPGLIAPLWVTAFLPLTHLVALGLIAWLRPPVRPTFVLGIALIATATVLQDTSRDYWTFHLAGQANAIGVGLFAGAAYVLQAESFPRGRLTLGPFVSFASACFGIWISPYLLGGLIFSGHRGVVSGLLFAGLAVASWFGLRVSGAETAAEDEAALLSGSARRRLFLLAGLLSVGLMFLAFPAPSGFKLGLGAIGPISERTMLRTGVGQILPLLLGGAMLLWWRGLAQGVRLVSATILLSVAVGWFLPWSRSSAPLLATPLDSWAVGLISIAFARGLAPQNRLRAAISVQLVTTIAGIVATFALLPWIGFQHDSWSAFPKEPYPIGLTVSLVPLLGVGAVLLASRGRADASHGDPEPPTPNPA